MWGLSTLKYLNSVAGYRQIRRLALAMNRKSKIKSPKKTMKVTSLIVSLLLLCINTMFGQSLVPPYDGKITLEFDYPPAEITNVTLRIRESATFNTSYTNWPVAATFTGTNRVQIIAKQPQGYYVASASNFWGEVFSNVATTPPLPRGDVNLNPRRGH